MIICYTKLNINVDDYLVIYVYLYKDGKINLCDNSYT
jgi:hypothetical protein